MTDTLFDDVKALLEKDFGDDRILKQIYRACQNDEVISNYERNYVRKLAEKHLGKRPEIKKETVVTREKPVTPDVSIPQSNPIQKIQEIQTPKTSSSGSKNSKIMIAIAGIVLVVIVGGVAAFSGGQTTGVAEDPLPTPVSLSVETDLSSYSTKDLISINGISENSNTVDLLIENSNDELVWKEQLSVKSDGTFSTLVIAGGPNWNISGVFTISVEDGNEIKTTTFSFTT